MKNKFKFLISMSLKRKIITKWFVIANILLAIGIIGVTNIDSIIKSFGGDFDKQQVVMIKDETYISYDLIKKQLEAINKDEKYKFEKTNKSEKELEKALKKDKDAVAIVVNPSEKNVIDVKLLSKEYIKTLDYQYFTTAIYNTKVMLATQASNIPPETLVKIYEQIEIERIIYDDSKNKEQEAMETIMSTVFPIFILPIFMLIIFLVQMIGAEVNDEKTTRGMEIIISNVSPKVHFFSKVLSGNIFIAMQGLLLIAYSIIGFGVRHFVGGDEISNGVIDGLFKVIKDAGQTEFISKLGVMLPLLLIVLVLTFLAYSLIAGILASMTTNTEDFQQIQTPIMITLLIGYYLAIMAGMFKGSIFIKICSFIPFISAILAPSLLMIGDVGVFEIFISIFLLIITNFLLIKYGLRIYKVGILNYSSKDLFKKIVKAVKEK